MARQNEVLYIRGLPDELKAKFKAYCAKKDVSMKAAIANFMVESLLKEEKRELRRLTKRKQN